MGVAQTRRLAGWGRTAPTRALVQPIESEQAVLDALETAPERGVLARGLGRAYGDAAQNGGGLVLDMTALDGTSVAEGDVVQASAGTSIGNLIAELLPSQRFPTVVPGTRHVTVGGAIAADIHGKNHHLNGSFCDHVESFVLLTPAGERMEVKPGDEAFEATAGGMGLTGVITSARLRVHSVESALMLVDTERASDLDDLLSRLRATDADHRYSVAWIDCLARGRSLGRAVLMRGDHARSDDLPASRRDAPLRPPPDALLAAPPWVPRGLLNRATVQRFQRGVLTGAHRSPSTAACNRCTRSSSHSTQSAAGTGSTGAAASCSTSASSPSEPKRRCVPVLERLSSAGTPAFLAVLKAMGPGRGLLSFPGPGWTLALDIPVLPWLARLLDELDRACCRGRRARVPGQGRAPTTGPPALHVPRAAALGGDTRAPRPGPGHAIGPRAQAVARSRGAGTMKDALGSVQSALVLGGSSDIGRAIVSALVADRTRKVILAARDPDALGVASDELRAAGAQVDAVAFDATETAAHQALIDSVFDDHGDIDLVLVTFGVLGKQADLLEDPAAAAESVQVNFTGATAALLAVAHRMRRQGHGTIVVLSSVAGERARRSNFVYGSAKAGLDAFAQGLADELAPAGIDVIVVRPGMVRTKMTTGMEPVPLTTTAEAVAEDVVAAIRKGGSRTVWSPPALRYVMTALRLLPRPIFRRLDL